MGDVLYTAGLVILGIAVGFGGKIALARLRRRLRGTDDQQGVSVAGLVRYYFLPVVPDNILDFAHLFFASSDIGDRGLAR
jgi:hypothetical protein